MDDVIAIGWRETGHGRAAISCLAQDAQPGVLDGADPPLDSARDILCGRRLCLALRVWRRAVNMVATYHTNISVWRD